jgi:UDP-N-acetylmuramate--alanine ligase
VGSGELFVSEVDESDGSISLYQPRFAVLGNVTLDHKSLDELRNLFLGYLLASEVAILNLDDEETRLLSRRVPGERLMTFSFEDEAADLLGGNVVEAPLAISFSVTRRNTGEATEVQLAVPGRHNAYNALAALSAVAALGIDLPSAAQALAGFTGLRRRFEVVGTRNGISIIDDFGHNPDKIAATLSTLHAFPGRLVVLFQPHGYGPLKTMGDALIKCFAENLSPEDTLIITDPVYFGGTVERSVGSAEIVSGIKAAGRNAEHVPERTAAGLRLRELAREGDRIIVMGARDDTLSTFAAELLGSL